MIKRLVSFWPYLLLFLHAACTSSGKIVDRVTIYYMNSSVETIVAVSCDNFDRGLAKNSLLTKQFNTVAQIRIFMKSLTDYKSPLLVKNIDVRAKAYVFYSTGKVSTVCTDQFGDLEIDGAFLGVSKSLLSFIQQNCDGFK
jgi:hypothetical protein